MIDSEKLISVYNYNENVVVVTTRDGGLTFDPAEDDVPNAIPLNINEIEYINSTSVAFKSGLLRFPEDMQEEIYDRLRITNWQDILTNDEIKDILTNPTKEGLQRLVDIKSHAIFSRVRGIFTQLKNEELHDLSTRVEKIIKVRYKELQNKQYKTNIQLTSKDAEVQVAPTKKVEELEAQLAEMREMMAQMLQVQSKQVAQISTTEVVNEVPTPDADATEKEEIKPLKSAGRPPKTPKN